MTRPDRESRFDDVDLTALTIVELEDYLDRLFARHVILPDPYFARAYELRIAEVQGWIQRDVAIRNRRETERQDGLAPPPAPDAVAAKVVSAKVVSANRVREVVRGECAEAWARYDDGELDREGMVDAIADRAAAQLVPERPVALSAGDLEVIDGALDFWLRRGGTAPREDIVRIRATLITGTPSAGPIQPSTAPPPGHVCPAPYGLGPEDLDHLQHLADNPAGLPRTRAIARTVLAAHTCPEPTFRPLPEVIACGTPGCVSSITKTYLPSGWRLTDGVWACPRCKVLATTEVS